MSRKRSGGRAAAAEEEVEQQPAPTWWRGLWERFGTLLIAVAVALTVRSCVIEPYRIPSGSMFPTLVIGDHLFVNKFIYGVKIPFTDLRLPAIRKPRAGDVVVFTVSRQPGNKIRPADRVLGGLSERFVKRIVAGPGDRLEVRGARLWVNGVEVPTEVTGEIFADGAQELSILEEDLSGHLHRFLDDPRAPGEHKAFEVEPGRYFMMGDNRDHSNDSRYWGTVRVAEMKGPAWIIYWSWDWDGRWVELANPVTWWELLTDKMRWDRMGDRIR